MKQIFVCILGVSVAAALQAQERSSAAFIQQDTSITWAAECNKVINLCDESDPSRIKQTVTYRNGGFSIHTIFISPLCVRKKPAAGKNVVLLKTDSLHYDFSANGKSSDDSVLTVDRPSLVTLLLQDLSNGKLKAMDYETGETIPYKDFLTWKIAADTLQVYDTAGSAEVFRLAVVKKPRDPDKLGRIRITQEQWFDFRNEKLISVILSVVMMEAVRTPDGQDIIGWKAFCRLEKK